MNEIIDYFEQDKNKIIIYLNHDNYTFYIKDLINNNEYVFDHVIDIRSSYIIDRSDGGCFIILICIVDNLDEYYNDKYIPLMYMMNPNRPDKLKKIIISSKVKNNFDNTALLSKNFDIVGLTNQKADKEFVFCHPNLICACKYDKSTHFIFATLESIWIYDLIKKTMRRSNISFHNIRKVIYYDPLLFILDGNVIKVFNRHIKLVDTYKNINFIEDMMIIKQFLCIKERNSSKTNLFKIINVKNWNMVTKYECKYNTKKMIRCFNQFKFINPMFKQ